MLPAASTSCVSLSEVLELFYGMGTQYSLEWERNIVYIGNAIQLRMGMQYRLDWERNIA
jgi:hypothetical protein